MIYKYLMNNATRYASKWLVLAVDVVMVLFTFFLVYFIRFDLSLNFNLLTFLKVLPIMALLTVMSFLLVGSYRGIIRYTGFRDLMKIFMAVTLLSVLTTTFVVANKQWAFFPDLTIPKSIIILHAFLNFVFLAATRVIFKLAYKAISCDINQFKRVLIYGAGDSGIMTLNALVGSYKQQVQVVAFIDDDTSKIGNSINGTPIIDFRTISKEYLDRSKVDEVIIAIQGLRGEALKQRVDYFMDLGLRVKMVPPFERWIKGELQVSQIKSIQLEDLLGRTPINIMNKGLQNAFSGKIVLVTGAAGSIGSEIVRQLSNYNLKKLIMLDIAESALYDLQQELHQEGVLDFYPVVGDIRDTHTLQQVFEKYKPQIVFHAAAYKHVPLMEENPYEAVKINVGGTRLLALAAVRYGVEKFVMVSTDKAVNPTNVMGATKRAAEIYIGALQNESQSTKFITTRFGNVLGSNGSVIPLFRKQIEKGGPLTLTHKDITRYFMTIPEASQLVLEAGAMGQGGEIFVFDMGQSVKIFDLAKNMIRLSGLRYPEDIDIEITGLRPGEKLYEELLANGEDTLPTYHDKIMISKVKDLEFDKLKAQIESLCVLQLFKDKNILVRKLKEIVPEFKSQNSDFEKLDETIVDKSPKYSILQSLNFNPHQPN